MPLSRKTISIFVNVQFGNGSRQVRRALARDYAATGDLLNATGPTAFSTDAGKIEDFDIALQETTQRRIGLVMSGLVIAFMLFDGFMKLVPFDVVVKASADLGLPVSPEFARELGILGFASTLL